MEQKKTTEKKDEALVQPSLAPLEKASDILLETVEDADGLLQAYYVRLAQEAGQSSKPSPELDESVHQEVESLKRTSNKLNQALITTHRMEDELRARLTDTKRSRDRKWYLPNPPANSSIDLAEEQQGHFARGINLYKILLVCIVGSFAGVLIEMLWCLIRHGYIESRAGLIWGPFNLLYGVGAVMLTVCLYRFRNRGRWLSFLGGFVVGSVVEYVCSWGQELIFGSRSWDYSNVPFNINGRICVLYSVFWGVLGIFWIKDIYPRMAKWILKLPNKAGKIITWVMVGFLVVNAAVTCVAVERWSHRLDGEEPSSGFWEMIDERFPDERMEKVFANMEFD